MNKFSLFLHPSKMDILPVCFAGLLRLLHHSCHISVLGKEYEEQALSRGKSIIYTTWHFAFPAVVYYFRNRNGMLMVSPSRDGEWASRVLKHLGYQTVRGSSGKGGGTVLRQIIAHVCSGRPGGFIADGSRGPARIAQKGILVLARHTGAPLLPVGMAANPCWRFRSWDRTMLAKPFSKVVLAFADPLWVEKNASPEKIEQQRKDLEASLNRLTQLARQAVGLPPEP